MPVLFMSPHRPFFTLREGRTGRGQVILKKTFYEKHTKTTPLVFMQLFVFPNSRRFN